MYISRTIILIVLMTIITTMCMVARADNYQTYSRSELDNLMGPIALYPDPLIAQILPAATYLDQLRQADDLARYNGGSRLIDSQNWDVSVKSVAHYPRVLRLMIDSPHWCIAIGQAYVYQNDDVMDSIQRLRIRARHMGYLRSNRHQRMYDDGGYVRIVPADPTYMYAPTYDPGVVYTRSYSGSSINPWVAFGVGLLIGSWLDRDVNWHNHDIYYHGWNGGGWVGQSRSRVDTNNRYYVNNSFNNRPVYVNRSVENINIGDYRAQIRQNQNTYRLPRSQTNLHSFGRIPVSQAAPQRRGLQFVGNNQNNRITPNVHGVPIGAMLGANSNRTQHGKVTNVPRFSSTTRPNAPGNAPMSRVNTLGHSPTTMTRTPSAPRFTASVKQSAPRHSPIAANSAHGRSPFPGQSVSRFTPAVKQSVIRHSPTVVNNDHGRSSSPTIRLSAPRNVPSVRVNTPRTAPSVRVHTPRNAPSVRVNAPRTAPSIRVNTPRTAPSVRVNAPRNAPSVRANAPRNTPSVRASAPRNTPSVRASAPRNAPSVRVSAPRNVPSVRTSAPRNAPSARASAPATGGRSGSGNNKREGNRH